MGVQNGGQWSGLRRRGAPVKTQAGKVTGDAIPDRPPGTGDPGPLSDAARRLANISGIFLVSYRGDSKRR